LSAKTVLSEHNFGGRRVKIYTIAKPGELFDSVRGNKKTLEKNMRHSEEKFEDKNDNDKNDNDKNDKDKNDKDKNDKDKNDKDKNDKDKNDKDVNPKNQKFNDRRESKFRDKKKFEARRRDYRGDKMGIRKEKRKFSFRGSDKFFKDDI